MAKKITYSISTAQFNDIDKVNVELWDSIGSNLLSTNSHTPPFASSITGQFTALNDPGYRTIIEKFIGLISVRCPAKIINMGATAFIITGDIKINGSSISIENLSQSIPCSSPIDLNFASYYNNTSQNGSATVVVPSGNLSGVLNNADGNSGLVLGILPNSGSEVVKQIQCNGNTYEYRLTIPAPVSPPVTPPAQVNVTWGYTQLDTINNNPTESEFVNSISNGSTVSYIMQITAGANVFVTFPTDVGFKVFFIQVPDTQAAFTKWDSVGNPIQVNQPMETFGSGNNIWFKSTLKSGYITYITRSQTLFTEQIKLYR